MLSVNIILLGSISGAIAYGLACAWLWMWQSRLIFFPNREQPKHPGDFGADYQEVWIPSADQSRLHGWWIPSEVATDRVLIYLHGNSDNICTNAGHAVRLQRIGFSVLIIDYRGYGQSDRPFPNEQRVYEDAEAAWQYLHQQTIDAANIWVYGHSLGGAIAINLAQHHPDMAGLIIESTFTSMRDMAIRTTIFDRFFPLQWLLHQRFESDRKVPTLSVPMLFIHGLEDEEVPSDMSETLYGLAIAPKRLYQVPMADHNNVANTAGVAYQNTVRDFITSATSAPLSQS